MTRSVLVTGSSRGIGRAIALQLANDGFEVVVHCFHHPDQGQQVVQDIQGQSGRARLLQFDVGDEQVTRQVLQADMEANETYYGVVCNAGITRDQPFPSMESEDWGDVVRTNLDSFYHVLHPLTLPMIRTRRGGRIVTLSSMAGLMGNRGQVNYSAAKAGIIGATKALAVELAKRAITVNCVVPGIIETDMTSHLPEGELLKLIPAKRLGKPSDVAGLVGFLFSDQAGYITRQVISVNGGML